MNRTYSAESIRELAQAWVKHGYCDDDNLFVRVLFVRVMDLMRAVADGSLTLQPSEPVTCNQCDGCARGLSVNANGTHIDADGLPIMSCTKDCYSEPVATPADAGLIVFQPGSIAHKLQEFIDFAEQGNSDGDKWMTCRIKLALIDEAKWALSHSTLTSSPAGTGQTRPQTDDEMMDIALKAMKKYSHMNVYQALLASGYELISRRK